MYEQGLPLTIWKRIAGLVSRDMAVVTWHRKRELTMSDALAGSLVAIRDYLLNEETPWSAPIALVIPRDPHFFTVGDASNKAAGSATEQLKWWTDVVWSPTTRQALRLPASNPAKVCINELEFIMVILQYAGSVVRIRQLTPQQIDTLFPQGMPAWPVLQILTDNTTALTWAHKTSTSSIRGQNLIAVFCELLCLFPLGLNCEHIPGVENVLADDISRPPSVDIDHSVRVQQLITKYPFIKTWDYFLPSPELLQLLSLRLSMTQSLGLPSLPTSLGQFVPTASTISNSPVI